MAQVVRGSGVWAATFRLWLGGEIPAGGSVATVTAIMTALEAVTPGAGTGSGSARIVVVRAVPGEEFDGPAEEVAGRAPERDATNPMAGVVRALAGRELLMIVLDNCEHVLGSVSRHLSHIFAKLGITTRAELAAQAAAQDLTAR